MRKHIIIFLAAFFLIFCVLYGFQKQQEQLPPEKHEVVVRLVMVDVIVTKNGKFVTDLTKDDFELYEDGVSVSINSLELMSFAERRTASVEETPVEEVSPTTPFKRIIVVFDEVNSITRHLKRGAKKIMDELVSLVKQGNEAMIIRLNKRKGVEIVQPFTTDEKLIQFAVGKAVGSIWGDKSLDALAMVKELGIEGAADQAQAQRVLGTPQAEESILDDYKLSEVQKFEISVGGILAVLNVIKDIAGRKAVLLVSDGLPDISPQRGVGTIKAVKERPRVFDPFNILKKEKNMDGNEIIQELIRYANSQNISIYTLDPGTFTEYFYTVSAESSEDIAVRKAKGIQKIIKVQNLSWLSKDTGAVSLRGAKKFDRFKQVMSTDLNYYYELSYYPPRKTADNNYHRIEVKVKRSGVNVRSRKGYTDYSDEEQRKILLLSAFYSPKLYKKMPFEAELIPYCRDLNKYIPWMSVALPVKELLKKGGVTYGSREFNLHIWVMDKEKGESSYQGQINIPLNIDSSFMELMELTDNFCFHFTGPEIEFSQKKYQVIFALYDEQTKEIGTWESSFSLPDINENSRGAIINCILGSLTSNPSEESKSFTLSKKGGGLEYGDLKFYPSVNNQFYGMEDVSVFLQTYLPQGKPEDYPVFTALKEDGTSQEIQRKLVVESWKENSKVWSGIFRLDLSSVSPGEHVLRVSWLVSENNPPLDKDVKLKIWG